MDQELEKPDDEIDFDLIEDCSRALIEVQTGETIAPDVLRKMMTDARILKCAKRITVRNLSATEKLTILANVLLATGLTVYAGILVAPKMFAPVETTTVAAPPVATTKAAAVKSTVTMVKVTEKTTQKAARAAGAGTDDSIFVRDSAAPTLGVYKIV